MDGDFGVSFDVDNKPNADILMASLRVSGYTLEGVLEDLADNSVDADAATVLVHLERDDDAEEWTLYVADDGHGMDREALDQMMRLGSRVERDLDTDLGAFGVGSDTATLAIARRKHVITLGEDGLLSSIWDLDVIRERKEFVKHLGPASDEEARAFAAAFETYGVDAPEHGTVVFVRKADRVYRTQLHHAAAAVVKSFAGTYRRFLEPNGPLTIAVNGVSVRPSDPLMLDHSETEILYDDRVEFAFRDGQGRRRVESFDMKIVHLPDFGGAEANRRAGMSIERSGFYVLRNNREIVRGTTLGLYKRHNELIRFRAQASFPGVLDEQLGVTFLKSAIEVNPSQALRDKITEVSYPYRRQSQRRFRASRKNADVQVPHDEAAKHIKGKSLLLRMPRAEVEPPRRAERGTPRGRADRRSVARSRGMRDGQTPARRKLATDVRFEAQNLGPHAPFFEPTLDQSMVVVIYNADHPAYDRMILENRENRGQLAAVDYFVYSLAVAELREIDDERADLAERMRLEMSFNLSQLLKS
jgi:hypothetical protein